MPYLTSKFVRVYRVVVLEANGHVRGERMVWASHAWKSRPRWGGYDAAPDAVRVRRAVGIAAAAKKITSLI